MKSIPLWVLWLCVGLFSAVAAVCELAREGAQGEIERRGGKDE